VFNTSNLSGHPPRTSAAPASNTAALAAFRRVFLKIEYRDMIGSF